MIWNNFLQSNDINGFSRDEIIEGVHVYLKPFILLLTDDTVIVSEN
jgi:hypothetical protein